MKVKMVNIEGVGTLALLVTKRAINLLSGSKIINQYPVLIKFINETPRLQDTELHTLDKETVRFFKNIYNKVLNEAIKEWVVDVKSIEYFPGDTMKCQLCGKRPINNICIIENSFTGKKLKIGTECAKHFGISRNVNIDKLLEESKKVKNLEELDKQFPGIEREIDNWETFLTKQPILVKKEVKDKYLELGTKAKEVMDAYIDIKTSEKERKKLLKDIKEILKNRDQEIKRIKKYVKNYKNNPLVPSMRLIQKLKASGANKVVAMLEEDGVIRHRTLFRIEDQELAEYLVGLYNEKLKSFDCFIEKVVSKNGLGYQYLFKRKSGIKLFCRHRELCINYYNFITGDEGDDIDFQGLLKISELYDEVSTEKVFFEFFKRVKPDGFTLDSVYYNYNEIFLYNKKSNLFYILDLRKLVKNFMLDFFIHDKNTKKILNDYLLMACRKPVSAEDIKHFKETRN